MSNEIINELVSPKPAEAGNAGNDRTTEIAKPATPPPNANISNRALDAVITRRKAGRHKADCNCENCAKRRESGGKNDAGKSGKAASPAAVALDDATCKAAIEGLTHICDLSGTLIVERELRPLSFLTVADKTQFLEKVPMRKEIRSGVVTSGSAVAQKYGVTKMLPEVALSGFILSYFGGVLMLVREIRAIGAEFKKNAQTTETSKNEEKTI